jgi:hypothetical protein
MQIGEVPITYADITKSKKLLNFSPKTDLGVGLAHFLSWYTLFVNDTRNRIEKDEHDAQDEEKYF